MVKPTMLKAIVMLSVALLLSSCLKLKPSVRIINNYPDDITNLKVGPADFGTVTAGSTTGYIEVSEGSNTLSGTDAEHPTIQLTGSLSVDGKGKHKWTITISSSGSLSIVKDL
ncbi:MAG TPA: hypothetical protein VNB90_03895 [Cytophagaceae bacterium]|nr:hypothetical protein [Cytophagaceae bacterium]